jgi:hypothetical protein
MSPARFERFLLVHGERVVRVATRLMTGERRTGRPRQIRSHRRGGRRPLRINVPVGTNDVYVLGTFRIAGDSPSECQGAVIVRSATVGFSTP